VVAGSASRGTGSSIGRYVEAVLAELELRAAALDERFGSDRLPLQSLYLGGGTPSILPAAAVVALIETVRRRFGLAPDAEVTIEANPGPEERGDAGALRAAGVTRLSIGAQSLDPRELRALGRRHRPEDVAATVGAGRVAGIESIGLDLLYDVPGQTLASWAATLAAALALEPDHLSLYALTLDDPAAQGLTGSGGDHLPASRGALRWRERARSAQDEDRAAEMYGFATERLAAAGFVGYEISNWARTGHESRHNLAYWRRLPHEAVGPGAHAFDGVTRRWNAAAFAPYLDALTPPAGAPPSLPPGGEDRPTDGEATSEALILALRLRDGVSADVAQAGPLGPHLPWAIAAGLLEEPSPGRFALTTRGRLLSNELFSRLI
jgi:coproporphyrinogen III oxidase-like Fe-S oxidoreductase